MTRFTPTPLNPDKVGPPARRPIAPLFWKIATPNKPSCRFGRADLSWIDKGTGKKSLLRDPVIKPTAWGYRGWWLVRGMEWAVPTDDDRLNEASPWNYTLYLNEREVSVSLSDTEKTTGLVAEVNISLDADHAYFTLTPRVLNPNPQPVSYKFWINGMFNLGQPDPRPDTRFVLPAGEVFVHSTGDQTLPAPGQLMTWPYFDGRDMSAYSSWQKYLGVFSSPAAQSDFMGAYNRKSNLGVVRIFPHMLARGAKIFAPADLDPVLWTTDKSGYFELWGGLAPTFWDTVSLDAGAWITWQERWYAVGDMGGFGHANAEAALNLGILADSVQVAAASTTPIDGYLVLWNNKQEANRWPVSLPPESPFRSSFAIPGGLGKDWGLSLFARDGREVAAYGQTLPTLPDKKPTAMMVTIPATLFPPTYTPTATPIPVFTPTPTATATPGIVAAATATATLPPDVPTPTPLPPSATPLPVPAKVVTVVWDNRLTPLNVTLVKAERVADQPVFRLVSAKYLNEGEAAGLHHVFVEVLDENGQRIVGQPVTLSWRDGKSQMITEDKPAPEFAANAPLYGSTEEGTYKVYVDGAPSDIVTGLGLPGSHHVGYQLVFQRNVETAGLVNAPTPGTPPAVTATPVSTAQPTSTPAGGGGAAAPTKTARVG